MAFLLAHSLVSGPKGGVAVATGIFLSDLLMSALTAAGVTALVLEVPGSFDVIRVVGAAYLLWLAYQALRSAGGGGGRTVAAAPFTAVMRASMVNSLLNPKAFVFFVVFIPQFADPGKGSLSMQLAILGLVLSLEAWIFHASLGMLGSSVGPRLGGAGAARWSRRLQASVFLLLALRLAVMDSSA
jgi:threonine/homoserine/homoserine lactone efflux protein